MPVSSEKFQKFRLVELELELVTACRRQKFECPMIEQKIEMIVDYAITRTNMPRPDLNIIQMQLGTV